MDEGREKFKCDKCGACCRHVGLAEETKFLDRGDGVCKYFNETNKTCIIENFKPDVCNIEKMYKKYKDKMTWEEYLKANYEACEYLKELDRKERREAATKKETEGKNYFE